MSPLALFCMIGSLYLVLLLPFALRFRPVRAGRRPMPVWYYLAVGFVFVPNVLWTLQAALIDNHPLATWWLWQLTTFASMVVAIYGHIAGRPDPEDDDRPKAVDLVPVALAYRDRVDRIPTERLKAMTWRELAVEIRRREVELLRDMREAAQRASDPALAPLSLPPSTTAKANARGAA